MARGPPERARRFESACLVARRPTGGRARRACLGVVVRPRYTVCLPIGSYLLSLRLAQSLRLGCFRCPPFRGAPSPGVAAGRRRACRRRQSCPVTAPPRGATSIQQSLRRPAFARYRRQRLAQLVCQGFERRHWNLSLPLPCGAGAERISGSQKHIRQQTGFRTRPRDLIPRSRLAHRSATPPRRWRRAWKLGTGAAEDDVSGIGRRLRARHSDALPPALLIATCNAAVAMTVRGQRALTAIPCERSSPCKTQQRTAYSVFGQRISRGAA